MVLDIAPLKNFIATTTGTSAGYRRRLKSILGELPITSGQAQKLAVQGHSQLSPYLEACCLRLSANVSYQRAAEDIEYFTGMQVSVLIEFNGEADHVHLLIDLHPDNNISALIGSLKSASSRVLRQEFAEHLEQHYWSKPVLWSGAYYIASCGGAPIEKIKEYIQSQETPD